VAARRAGCGGARAVFFDVDDAVMLRPLGAGWLSRWRAWRRFLATARILDQAVAGNRYLAEMFQAQGCGATVIPSVVDPHRYPVKHHKETREPRLVWIGSRSTLPYLQAAAGAIALAARRVPGLRLVTIADATIDAAELPVEPIAWSAETEGDSLCRGDIGIAPTPRDRWTLGKCGFKIIQCMAAGLPVIASPVGANAEIVRAGETGILAESDEEWAAAIETLATSAASRARQGRAGRERVERDYSLDTAARAWAEVLRAT
jgi:glycosyltransferase involved in cell wall biosynthesis